MRRAKFRQTVIYIDLDQKSSSVTKPWGACYALSAFHQIMLSYRWLLMMASPFLHLIPYHQMHLILPWILNNII